MIYNKYMESGIFSKFSSVIEVVKKAFSLKNIIFAILALMLANENIIGGQSLFSFVLFGVASLFNVPLILVLLFSTVGLAFGGFSTILIVKLLAFFAIFTLITAIINIEGIGKKYSVYIKYITSAITVELIFNLVQGTFVTNFFEMLSSFLIISIFYFIFASGIAIIQNLGKGFVYSKEESVAMIAVCALSLSFLNKINIFGYLIFNVLILILVLIYGWKSGAIAGAAAGIVIGLLLTMVTSVTMTFVVALAFSGAVAGILSRFGKISVVIGFILGNVYIAYYANGISEVTTVLAEVLVASIALLFIPKKLEQKISNLFNENNTLTKPYDNILGESSNVKSRIGAVSEVFDNLSNITLEKTEESTKETRDVIQKYIENFIQNSCIYCKEKSSCINKEALDLTIEYIAMSLENNQEIDKRLLDFHCDSSEKIISDIKEIYNSMKLMRILKEKEKENTVKLSNQYKEVSKILSNVAKNIKNEPILVDKFQEKLREELKFYGYIIYEDEFLKEGQNIEYTFVTDILTNIDKQKKQIVKLISDILEQNMNIKLILNSSKTEKSKIKLISTPAYEIQSSIISEMKNGEGVSGDSYLCLELQDLKKLSVLSDGAGSGIDASNGSTMVINILEKLLTSGFNEEKAIEIINSVLKLKGDDTNFSTLDAAIISLKTAEAQFIKIGAAPTYIIDEGRVITINNQTIPLGLVKDTDYLPICKKLDNDMIIIQVTDGVILDNMDILDNYFINYLKEIDKSKNSKIISEELHKLVLKEHNFKNEDDFTIIVSKVKKTVN